MNVNSSHDTYPAFCSRMRRRQKGDYLWVAPLLRVSLLGVAATASTWVPLWGVATTIACTSPL